MSRKNRLDFLKGAIYLKSALNESIKLQNNVLPITTNHSCSILVLDYTNNM